MTWIDLRIEKASWRSFAIWFAAWFAYNWWAINSDSPWTRAFAAGGGALPESQFGFPSAEPQRSLDALGPAISDYIVWQALDIPYALLNVAITSIAMALGLKAVRLGKTPARLLLLLPLLYFACEIVEDAAVALFAARLLPVDKPFVVAQQIATNAKLASGYGSMWLGLLGLAVAAGAGTVSLIRLRLKR